MPNKDGSYEYDSSRKATKKEIKKSLKFEIFEVNFLVVVFI